MYDLSKLDFTPISEADLDHHVLEIAKQFPQSGEGMVKGILLQRGIKVVRDSLHRVAPL